MNQRLLKFHTTKKSGSGSSVSRFLLTCFRDLLHYYFYKQQRQHHYDQRLDDYVGLGQRGAVLPTKHYGIGNKVKVAYVL